ncbi:MAG: sigma-70 family RNA polymerase sigma factor [Candidatus Brocadiae bacterium]|nr:sigma-70 family RNA polymerase sigma factor [Candidatus Brocadiia bacterium]
MKDDIVLVFRRYQKYPTQELAAGIYFYAKELYATIASKFRFFSLEEEDFVQDGILNLLNHKISAINLQNINQEEELRKLLFRIAINEARDIFRREKRFKFFVLQESDSLLSLEVNHAAFIEEQEMLELMLMRISKSKRELLSAKYIKEWSNAEILECFGFPSIEAVRQALYEARLALRRAYEELNED